MFVLRLFPHEYAVKEGSAEVRAQVFHESVHKRICAPKLNTRLTLAQDPV